MPPSATILYWHVLGIAAIASQALPPILCSILSLIDHSLDLGIILDLVLHPIIVIFSLLFHAFQNGRCGRL